MFMNIKVIVVPKKISLFVFLSVWFLSKEMYGDTLKNILALR